MRHGQPQRKDYGCWLQRQGQTNMEEGEQTGRWYASRGRQEPGRHGIQISPSGGLNKSLSPLRGDNLRPPWLWLIAILTWRIL